MRVRFPFTGVTRCAELRPRNRTSAPASIISVSTGRRSVENLLRHPVVHLAFVGVAHLWHILKDAARFGALDEQRDGKGGVVEVPAELLSVAGVVEIEGGQGVGVFVQFLLARTAQRKERKIGRIVERAQGRIGGDLVGGDAAF